MIKSIEIEKTKGSGDHTLYRLKINGRKIGDFLTMDKIMEKLKPLDEESEIKNVE